MYHHIRFYGGNEKIINSKMKFKKNNVLNLFKQIINIHFHFKLKPDGKLRFFVFI